VHYLDSGGKPKSIPNVINNAEEDIAEQENNLAIVENTYGEQSP
jgi:hypothetical protein